MRTFAPSIVTSVHCHLERKTNLTVIGGRYTSESDRFSVSSVRRASFRAPTSKDTSWYYTGTKYSAPHYRKQCIVTNDHPPDSWPIQQMDVYAPAGQLVGGKASVLKTTSQFLVARPRWGDHQRNLDSACWHKTWCVKGVFSRLC